MGGYPSVTVIVPVYENESGLNLLIDSLKEQNYPLSLITIVVIDNGSMSVPPVASLAPLRVEVYSCVKPGSYAARNVGFLKAKSDILAFTDSDCVADTGWLKSGVESLKAGGACIVGGDVRFIWPEVGTAVSAYQCLTGFSQEHNVSMRQFSVTANLFIERAKLNALHGFNEELLSGGDRDLCWRALEAGMQIIYSANTVVSTHPRMTLTSAVKQVRRVAGGRSFFRHNKAHICPEKGMAPIRGNFASLVFLWSQKKIGLWMRCKVVGVAFILKAIHEIEIIRLRLGGRPKRL